MDGYRSDGRHDGRRSTPPLWGRFPLRTVAERRRPSGRGGEFANHDRETVPRPAARPDVVLPSISGSTRQALEQSDVHETVEFLHDLSLRVPNTVSGLLLEERRVLAVDKPRDHGEPQCSPEEFLARIHHFLDCRMQNQTWMGPHFPYDGRPAEKGFKV